MHDLAIGQRVQIDEPSSRYHGQYGHIERRSTAIVWRVGLECGAKRHFGVQSLRPVYTGAEVVAALVHKANRPAADPPSPWVTVLVDGVPVEAVNVLIDLVRYAFTDEPARPKTTEGVPNAGPVSP